jgi:hypothetical protein
MWLFHLASLAKVTPKCVWLIVIGIFLIYINDIGEKLLSLSRLFAEDTSLGYSSQNVVEIENVINHDLCELNAWSTKWLMQHLVAIFQVWLNNTHHNYPIFHRHIQKFGGYILSTVFLDFVYLTYILIFAEYLNEKA